jgi:hypothetical protein
MDENLSLQCYDVAADKFGSIGVRNNHTKNRETYSTQAFPAFLSSQSSTILSGIVNSVIVGGINITADTSNTTYVTKLNVGDISGGVAATPLAIDANGMVVSGSTSGITDTFVSGMTFNNSTYDLTINRNDGTNFSENLSIFASDMVVTGGTYDINTGIVKFTNNSGGTFDVSGFSSGMTDSYTTTASLNGNAIEFNNNIQGSNFYDVDLTPLFTGNTVEYTDTFFVMNTGDDNTAVINNRLKPWSTILGAKIAAEIAVSSDPSIRPLVYVFNGSYSGESSLMYNGTYYFEPNTYVETASLTESLSKALFYAGGPDRDETPTYGVTCKVFGHAHFHAVPCSDEGINNNPWNNGIMTINDSGSTLEVNCDKLTGNAAGRQVAVSNDGTLRLVCDYMEFGSNYSAATGGYGNFDSVYLQNGTLDIDCNTLITNYPYSSSIRSLTFTDGDGGIVNSRININTIKSTAIFNDFSSSYHSTSIGFFGSPGNKSDNINVSLNIDKIESNAYAIHSLDLRSGNYEINVNKAVSGQGVFLWNRSNTTTDYVSMNIKGNYVTLSGNSTSRGAYIYNRNSDSKYYLDGVFETLDGSANGVLINDTNADRILMNGAFYSQTGTTVNISAIANPLVMENVYLYNPYGIYNIESTSVEVVNSLGTTYLDSQFDANTTINGLYSTLSTVYVPSFNISVIGSGTAVTTLAVDADGMVVSGTTGGGGGVSKYAASVPMTSGVVETITHNLSSVDITVQIKDSSGKLIIPDVINNYTTNEVDITVSTTETYRVIIIG